MLKLKKIFWPNEKFILALSLTVLVVVFAWFRLQKLNSTAVAPEADTRQTLNCDDLKYVRQNGYVVTNKLDVTNEAEAINIQLSVKENEGLYQLLNGYGDSGGLAFADAYGKYVISNDKKNLAYIMDNSVHIYNLMTKQDQIIYTKVPVSFPSDEYSISIEDFNFSEDSSQLAITTNESLLIYNLLEKSLSTIFTRKRDLNQGGDGIYGYYQPIFSPDGSILIIKTGYYEGGGALLVFLNNGNVIKDLPYFRYASGISVEGWMEGKLLIRRVGVDYNEQNNFYLADPITLEETKFSLLDVDLGENLRDFKLLGDNLYITTEKITPRSVRICNNANQIVYIDKIIELLYKIDNSNKQKTKLLEVDTTTFNNNYGLSLWGYDKYNYLGKDYLLISLRYQNSWGTINLLDENKPNELIEIKLP